MRKVATSLLIAGLLAGGAVVSCGTTTDSPSPEASTSATAATTVPAEKAEQLVPADARTITNPEDPQATLVLFTDYQCPLLRHDG